MPRPTADEVERGLCATGGMPKLRRSDYGGGHVINSLHPSMTVADCGELQHRFPYAPLPTLTSLCSSTAYTVNEAHVKTEKSITSNWPCRRVNVVARKDLQLRPPIAISSVRDPVLSPRPARCSFLSFLKFTRGQLSMSVVANVTTSRDLLVSATARVPRSSSVSPDAELDHPTALPQATFVANGASNTLHILLHSFVCFKFPSGCTASSGFPARVARHRRALSRTQ